MLLLMQDIVLNYFVDFKNKDKLLGSKNNSDSTIVICVSLILIFKKI